jgi:hypothetical protein
MGQRKMSKIDTFMDRDTAFEVRQFEALQFEAEQSAIRQRGALPAAPMAMPTQALEWPQRSFSRLLLISLALRRRPSRAGR